MQSWRRRTAVFVLVGGVFAAAGGVFLLTVARSARAEPQEPQSTCLTSIMTADDAGPADQFGWSVAIGVDFAFIGANFGKDNSQNTTGSVYVFQRDGVPWIQQAELLASGVSADDEFGASVAASGDRLIVGAPHDEKPGGQINTGVAYVFRLAGQDWVEDALLTARTYTQAGAAFGAAVAIDGDRLIVGAPEYDGGGVRNIGRTYFFERQPDETWKRLTPDATPAYGPGDQSGGAVGISGDWAIIGAEFTDEACPLSSTCNSGSAFIYRFNADTGKWYKHATLLPPGQAASQLFRFGTSVAIAGDIAVVGAIGAPQGPFFDAGAAYVYRRNDAETPGDLTDDVWVMEAPLAADDARQNDRFGHSVAISGDTIAVGAPLRNGGAGAVYLYRPGGESWAQVDMPTNGDPNTVTAFGWAVATNGDHAIVGAYYTNSISGAAYAFRISLGDDCNGNGFPDECDIVDDPLMDANGNGLPDSCECQADAQCDDGLFCNGSEVCTNGTCISPGSPCTGDDNQCDEENDWCVFRGDLDGDGDADLVDGDLFTQCMTGPVETATTGCEAADADHNNHVDLRDFGSLQDVFTGDLAVCGDGIIQSGEECDDGNAAPGDGCDETCQMEP